MAQKKQQFGEQSPHVYGGFLWLPAIVFWQELVVRLWAFGAWENILLVLLFSLALGAWMNLLCSLWKQRGWRVTAGILLTLHTLWLSVQTVYFTIFRTFLTVYSLGGGMDAIADFWREALSGIAKAALPLLLLVAPVVVFLAWGQRLLPRIQRKRRAVMGTAICAAVLQLAAAVMVNLSAAGALSPRYLYYEEFIPELSVSSFGVSTTLRLDIAQLLGLDRAWILPAHAETLPEETPPEEPETGAALEDAVEETLPEEPEVIEYAPNVMEIDFAALSEENIDKPFQTLNEWFSQREATMQNEYTDLFAGKNLLWFTAEGFSRFAVDPELTPTLYKLANSGFVFENFYNPLWWASTIDGEYVACTSMIPKSGAWSLYQARNNSLYFCMGSQLRALGYDTRAYHNHTYTYYNRDQSHPNMGYDYMGVGNGLDITKSWPESDLEMMEQTLPQLVSNQPFHAYYLTVSGHMNYNFPGNDMARKHKEEVAHLEMSETAKAYLACQMELDRALEYTLKYLEETGHLEDTVICLSADHYPYGLEQSVLEELNGGELDMRFDVFRSTLILWSGDMTESVTVTKPCSSLDILPTLSNLFGLEYDSRLLLGQDALCDSAPLVVLSDRSFITDLGRYDAKKGAFTPYDGAEVPEGYAEHMLMEVNKMFSNAKLVLEKDYYGKLGLYHETSD